MREEKSDQHNLLSAARLYCLEMRLRNKAHVDFNEKYIKSSFTLRPLPYFVLFCLIADKRKPSGQSRWTAATQLQGDQKRL